MTLNSNSNNINHFSKKIVMVDNEGQAGPDPLSVDQSEAYNILNDLESQGKITSEK